MSWSSFTKLVIFGAACLSAPAVPAGPSTGHYAIRDLSPRLRLGGCEEQPGGAIRCTSVRATRHMNPQGQYDGATLILQESGSDSVSSYRGLLICSIRGDALALERDATSGSLTIQIETEECSENERTIYDFETGVYGPTDGYSGSLTVNVVVRDPVNRVDQRMNIFGTDDGVQTRVTCQMNIGRYFQYTHAEINGRLLQNLEETEARQMSCHASGTTR